jgi:hypothetical protein
MPRLNAPLPERAESEEAAFALTSCYAAGWCQGDLCCPVRRRCSRDLGLELMLQDDYGSYGDYDD